MGSITQDIVIQKILEISRISRQINTLDLEKIASVCIHEIPKLISARFASLYLYNQDKQTLSLLEHNHPYNITRLIELDKHPDSPMRLALARQEMLLITDFKTLDSPVSRKYSRNYHSNSCIIAPLLGGDRILGILNLADKIDADAFDTQIDLPPIQLLCEIIGSAMSNIELYEEVQKKARSDSMTDLLNHRAFYHALDREVNRARRYKNDLSLLMIDLDGLKTINDRFGHQAGDSILVHVSRQIRRCIRETDIAARYGGDEFSLILPNTSLADAMHVAERLLKLVSHSPVEFNNHQIAASISVGLSNYRPGNSLEEFVNASDMALFEAKASGKNQIHIAPASI